MKSILLPLLLYLCMPALSTYSHANLDHYTLLGFLLPPQIPTPASYYADLDTNSSTLIPFQEKAIKKQYRAQAKLYHPDKQPSKQPSKQQTPLQKSPTRNPVAKFIKQILLKLAALTRLLTLRSPLPPPPTTISTHTDRFNRIAEAYATLSDPSSRALYDKELLTKIYPTPQETIHSGYITSHLPPLTLLSPSATLQTVPETSLTISHCQIHMINHETGEQYPPIPDMGRGRPCALMLAER